MLYGRYWSAIDGKLREASLLRNIKVRLLVSCWEQTHPLTFHFMWSLKSLCMEMPNCSVEAVSAHLYLFITSCLHLSCLTVHEYQMSLRPLAHSFVVFRVPQGLCMFSL